VLAGEAWWLGKDELFGRLIDESCPPSIDLSAFLATAHVKTASHRDGIGWDVKAIESARPISAQFSIWKESKMLELASEEAVSRADVALKNLEDHLTKFRSKVGNDLTSIKAASQRVQTESQAMAAQYIKARDMLTSPEFERAIANAERMAVALESISKLSETKLSFAVFSGGDTK